MKNPIRSALLLLSTCIALVLSASAATPPALDTSWLPELRFIFTPQSPPPVGGESRP